MADGVSVDLGALRNAAEGVTDTLNALATRKVSDIDAPRNAFGHDSLADAVIDFCDRWNIGVSHLANDAAEVANRLNHCVLAYEHADRTAHQSLDGILRLLGSDPAAQ